MARELKKILNNRIGLSVLVDEKRFEEQFANGYLLGEILSKFGLQPDFAFFHDLQDKETKIRNFSRILPALEDISMMLPFSDVQKIMQQKSGSATFLIYNLLKSLTVLPMRNPKWCIENAEKFQRKGTWGQFAAALNVDYETFRKMDDKYLIPGENHCRNLENHLRNFLRNNQPVDLALVPLRAEAVERNKYRSEWEDVVQTELDAFDRRLDNEAKIVTDNQTLQASRSGVRASKSTDPNKNAISKSELHVDRAPSPAIEVQTDVELQPIATTPVAVFATLPQSDEPVKSKPSVVFDRESYLLEIRRKANEYKRKKEDAAKARQDLWMDLIIERKHARELESALQVIRKINKKAERDRNEARAQLYKRREQFDQLCQTVHRRQEEDEKRQYEYVRAMVNQGFWDMLGQDALSEERLKTWCEKAELRYFPEIYQILCRKYHFCNKLVLDYYEKNFFAAVKLVAVEEADNFTPLVNPDEQAVHVEQPAQPPDHDPEPLFDDHDTMEGAQTSSDIFNTSDQPTVFYSNVEMEEYRDIVTQFPVADLGWMNEFVSTSLLEPPRNLGHIVSCVINSEEWRPAPPLQFKFSQKFVSLWIAGKRSSPLKKAVITKLAATYNLEVISVADLVQEAVQSALAMQSDVNDVKEKSGRRKSKAGPPGGNTGKRISISKLTRGRSRSLAASLSSLVSAGRSSPRDDLQQRLMRSLLDDGAIDPATLVDLIEQALEARIAHPKPKTPEQPLETSTVAETAKGTVKGSKKEPQSMQDGKHHGKSDSKSKLAETELRIPEKKEESQPPFGWILTDLPVSVEVLQTIEQRLGVYITDPLPARDKWNQSQLIPDDVGPKPRSTARSFFGAILHIDCPGENELLADPLSPGELRPPEDEATPVESQKTTKSSSKAKTGSSPQNPPSSHDDNDDAYSPVEIKRQLGKFFSSIDVSNESTWSVVEDFYRKFHIEHVARHSDWADPQRTFQAVAQTVELVMKFNRTICSYGVSPEAQAQINEILKSVCRYIWDYRSGIRLQLGQRLIGTRIGKSVVHYLFKQDICLVRDVYRKLEAQLREVASKCSDKIRKTVGLAIYRTSSFPTKDRVIVPLETAPKPTGADSVPNSDPVEQDALHDVVQNSVHDQARETEFPSFELSETERKAVQGHNDQDPSSENALLNDWLQKHADNVVCWHRKNELIAEVCELNPPPEKPSILDFPFLGRETHPDLFQLWRSVEEQHADKILHIMPLLKMADCQLAVNTKHVKEIFADCVRSKNSTAQTLMSDFLEDFNKLRELHATASTGERWRARLDKLYGTLCDIVDFRQAGMLCCLRRLMGHSGYSQVIYGTRNACLELCQAEIDHFREVLVFLHRTYCEATTQNTDSVDPKFPDFIIPQYLLEEEPLAAVKIFLKEYDFEVPVKFNGSMTCGDMAEEQRVFVKITSDDDQFWHCTLQSFGLHLTECVKLFGGMLNRYKRSDEIELEVPFLSSEENDSANRNSHLLKSFTPPASDPPSASFGLPIPAGQDAQPWLDAFQQHDMEELLATVRYDVLKRQELKKSAQQPLDASTLQQTADQTRSPHEQILRNERQGKEAERIRLGNIIRFLLKGTVEQELNQTMLKLCRIAAEGTRKANVVRNTAAETFCVLDSWLRDVHCAEQSFVDKFVDNARDALVPVSVVSQHDVKWWTQLGLSCRS